MTRIDAQILLVEDSAEDADFLKFKLSQGNVLNADVDVVEWLSSALQAVAAKRYDLILCDLNVRDKSGIDTAIELIRAAPTVPLVVLSGREDVATAVNAVLAGAQSFVVKTSSLDAESFQREIAVSLLRQRDCNQKKELMVEREAWLTGEKDPLPPSNLVEPHLRHLEVAIQRGETYLARNAVGAHEAFCDILNESGFWTALRELRALVAIGESRRRGSAGEKAAKALRDSRPSLKIESDFEADRAFAEALVGLNVDYKGSQ